MIRRKSVEINLANFAKIGGLTFWRWSERIAQMTWLYRNESRCIAEAVSPKETAKGVDVPEELVQYLLWQNGYVHCWTDTHRVIEKLNLLKAQADASTFESIRLKLLT